MLLKSRTGGETYRIVTAVGSNNGMEAWRKLHKHFEPEVGVRIAQAQAEFTMMVNRQAKDTKELKHLLIEMEEKMKRVEEVTLKEVNDDHSKSVLTCMMDPQTRRHTINSQGEGVSFGELKTAVLRFINATVKEMEEAIKWI